MIKQIRPVKRRSVATGTITSSKAVRKIKTGICGLDAVLEGGIPLGRSLLVTGPPGVGKSVMLNEFIYRGIQCFKQPGVIVTFEQPPDEIIADVAGFGWDYTALIERKVLAFVDCSPDVVSPIVVSQDYDLAPFIERVRYAVRKTKAQRVVLDGLYSLFARFSRREIVRSALYQLLAAFRQLDVTVMISAEKHKSGGVGADHAPEEFLANGVIELDQVYGQQAFIRKMYVRKLRGTGFCSGVVEYEISSNGLSVFPKLFVDPADVAVSSRQRKKTGIAGLDKALHGGIPCGHMILVVGNTGTGKSLLGLQFLLAGLDKGEACLLVGLEEPVSQVCRTAKAHGWDLQTHEARGTLSFLSPGIVDIRTDKLLCEIARISTEHKVKRIVIDSVSSLMSQTMTAEEVRQFLAQLTLLCKSKGITCLLSYLSGANFGAARGQLLAESKTTNMRLSSIADGVVLLKYVERGQSVGRLLNILKMRGTQHAKDVFQYDIERGGIRLGHRYEI